MMGRTCGGIMCLVLFSTMMFLGATQPANAGDKYIYLKLFCETQESIDAVVDWAEMPSDCYSMLGQDKQQRSAVLMDIIDTRRDFNGVMVDIGKVRLMNGDVVYSVGRGLEV